MPHFCNHPQLLRFVAKEAFGGTRASINKYISNSQLGQQSLLDYMCRRVFNFFNYKHVKHKLALLVIVRVGVRFSNQLIEFSHSFCRVPFGRPKPFTKTGNPTARYVFDSGNSKQLKMKTNKFSMCFDYFYPYNTISELHFQIFCNFLPNTCQTNDVSQCTFRARLVNF